MAKADLVLNRIGNDGYEYARRIDGQWFFREGFCGDFGWQRTKWAAVDVADSIMVQEGLKMRQEGNTSYHIGFGHLVVITDGKGLRLPA